MLAIRTEIVFFFVNLFTKINQKLYHLTMLKQSWLISWIGNTDHLASEGQLGKDVGPVATALLCEKRYDQIYLLTNYAFERGKLFCAQKGQMVRSSSMVDIDALASSI